MVYKVLFFITIGLGFNGFLGCQHLINGDYYEKIGDLK